MSKNDLEKVEYQEFIINAVEKVGEHNYFNSVMSDYKLALTNGEVVRFSRSNTLLAPYFGEIIRGHIELNQQTNVKQLVTAKEKKPVDELKVNITGTQLYLAYLEQKNLNVDLTIEKFIAEFREFQKYLI